LKRRETVVLFAEARRTRSEEAARAEVLEAKADELTEQLRDRDEILTFAALVFLDLPYSPSHFELTSCPSTRTWSPLWSGSAMDSPGGTRGRMT
jgi:hypothetical protein